MFCNFQCTNRLPPLLSLFLSIFFNAVSNCFLSFFLVSLFLKYKCYWLLYANFVLWNFARFHFLVLIVFGGVFIIFSVLDYITWKQRQFYFLLSYLDPFISFLVYFLARTSNTVFNWSGESQSACLFLT